MNFLLTLVVSLIASQLTHALALNKHFGSVRASSFLTLIFIGATTLLPLPHNQAIQAVFLGSSFIGMTDPKRLTRVQICFASILFSLIFTFLVGYLKGPGGVLGFSAFMSCLSVHFIWRMISHEKLRFRIPKSS